MEPASAAMVISTGDPTFRLTCPPLSSVSLFLIADISAQFFGSSTEICATSGFAKEFEGMFFSTLPGRVTLVLIHSLTQFS